MVGQRRNLSDVKIASANAIAVFETFDLDSSSRSGSEKRIAKVIEQSEPLIVGASNAAIRDAEVRKAIDAIESIVVGGFIAHLHGLTIRADALRAKGPPQSMLETLTMTTDRIQRVEQEAVLMSRISEIQSISERLISAFAFDCRQAHSTIKTCEYALKSMRSWTGTRRDWVVTGVVTLIVTILLIPIGVVATGLWEKSTNHHAAATAQVTADPKQAVVDGQEKK